MRALGQGQANDPFATVPHSVHIKIGAGKSRCGIMPRSFMWDSGVPYWPRWHMCRRCLRSYRAAGNPCGAPASIRRKQRAVHAAP